MIWVHTFPFIFIWIPVIFPPLVLSIVFYTYRLVNEWFMEYPEEPGDGEARPAGTVRVWTGLNEAEL